MRMRTRLWALMLLSGLAVGARAELKLAFDFEDGGAGGVTADVSGATPAMNATVIEDLPGFSPVMADPKGSRGMVLNSAVGYVSAARLTPDKLGFNTSFTLQLWVLADQASPYHAQQWTFLAGAPSGWGPRVFTMNSGMLGACQLADPFEGWNPVHIHRGDAWLTETGLQGWHHLLLTYENTIQEMRGYVDGVRYATVSRSGTSMIDWTDPFNVGRANAGDTATVWLVDDVAYWEGAADDEVAAGLYNGTYTMFDAPIGWVGPPPPGAATRANLVIDGVIDWQDVVAFAQQWLEEGCPPAGPGETWQRCADWNESGRVDLADYAAWPAHWLETGFYDPCYGGPTAMVADRFGVPTFRLGAADWLTMPGYSNYYPNPPLLADFEQAGTRVYDFPSTPTDWPHGLPTVWIGPDSWYYGNLDDYFDRVIAADPDALIIPRLYLETPQWWLDDPAHSGEMELMDDGSGPVNYYSLYGTNPGILPRSGPFPSLASATWRADIGSAIEHYIDHLQEQGYLQHVIGFELSGLATEEWYHWSSNRQELAGYSAPTQAAFREWLRDRYNNDVAALRSAWNDPAVTFETAVTPSRTARKAYEGVRTFRDPAQYRNVVDWYQFYNELIPDTIDYFAGVIKNKLATPKLVGAFYAYMYDFQGSPEFGHNALARFNASTSLDYVYVTNSYMSRGAGGADLLRGPAYSVALHDKVWFPSNDTATIKTPAIMAGFGWDQATIDTNLALLGYTDTLEKNRWMFRRAAGQNTCNGFYQNFFDLHGGYYDDTGLMAEVAYLNQFYDRTKDQDRSRVSEVLVVADEYSCNYVVMGPANWNNNLLYYSLLTPQIKLAQMGAPADHVLLDDLALVDAGRYKLVVFLNCYHMSDAQRALVDSLKSNNRMLVFCYAPGYFNGSTMSEANMSSVVGMTLRTQYENLRQLRVHVTNHHALGQAILGAGISEFGPTSNIGKWMWVDDASAATLGYDPAYSTHETMAIKDLGTWRSVYTVTPDMPSAVYRELARAAGVHLYHDGTDTLYANASYVCLHANGPGQRTIQFPRPVDVYDALSETPLANQATSYTHTFAHGETLLLRYE